MSLQNTISGQVEICRGELPGRPKMYVMELTGELIARPYMPTLLRR